MTASTLPPPLSWAAGSTRCPVCEVEHTGICQKFREAYAAHNAALAKRLGIPMPTLPFDRADLLRRTRAIASQCRSREEILAALDEMVSAFEKGGGA